MFVTHVTIWDYKIAPTIKNVLGTIRANLAEFISTYWKHFSLDTVVPADFVVTVDFVQEVAAYIRQHRTWDGRECYKNPVEKARRLAFNRAERAALKGLENECGALSGSSLLGVCRWFGWHFTCRDECKDPWDEAWYNPKADTVYVASINNKQAHVGRVCVCGHGPLLIL